MDLDNENEGFEHEPDQFDLVEFMNGMNQQLTFSTAPRPQQNLQPPISTYLNAKNCRSPPQLSAAYSYVAQENPLSAFLTAVPTTTASSTANPSQGQKRSETFYAWCCNGQNSLQQQFIESPHIYRQIYSKFTHESHHNHKYYREYAKHQYKTYTDEDSIADSERVSSDDESDNQQRDDKQIPGISPRTRMELKPRRLDFLKIQRIISHSPKQLRFRSNFECANLQKVFIRLPQEKNTEKSSSYLRKTSQTESASLQSSMHSSLACQPHMQQSKLGRTYYLVLSNDTNTVGFNQWFYFKTMNPNYNKQILATFVIVNINKKIISNIQDIGIHCFSSTKYQREGIGWFVNKNGICSNTNNYIKKDSNSYYHTLQFRFLVHAREIVYFSLATPYSFSKLKDFTCRYAENFSILGHTFCGNPLYLYQVGNSSAKKSILITARQHPSQISSSYVAQGMVNRLAASTLLVNLLKKKYQIFVLPMVNPDGVIHGNSRTNLFGYDVNRTWEKQASKRVSFEVFNIVNFLLKKIPTVEYLIDLHGHSKKLNSFAYFSTKKSLATLISLEMAERLPYFRIQDCQMAMTAPLNTLRWYASTQLNVEKAITIETSIHGWVDENKNIRLFTPENLQQIGATLVDVISRIQLQKKSTLRSIKPIKFAQSHESSDSDPQRDYLKQIDQDQEKPALKPTFQQKPIEIIESPRRLRIKTTASSTFNKQSKASSYNTAIRERIRTDYGVEKNSSNFENGQSENKGARKKTLESKYNRTKQRNKSSIRGLKSGLSDLTQSISFKVVPTVEQSRKLLNSRNQRQQSMGQNYDKKKESRDSSNKQSMVFDQIILRRSKNFQDLNIRKERIVIVRTRPKDKERQNDRENQREKEI